MSHIADRLESLELSFPIPADKFFEQDILGRKYDMLILAALDAIHVGVGSNVATPDDGVPVTAAVSVTSAGVILAAASTLNRKVGVYNGGAKDIIILEGGLPGFTGQDPGSGVLAADFGIVLEPTDYFESPVAHKGAVNARARDTESSMVTVTKY